MKAFKGNKFNRLAIDFDGVIMRPTRKRFNPAICPGDIVPGAAEAIEHLASRYMLTVFSARANSEEGAAAIAEWLSGHGLLKFFKGGITAQKPHALAYIDDRARRFESWGCVVREFGSDIDPDLDTLKIKHHAKNKDTN